MRINCTASVWLVIIASLATQAAHGDTPLVTITGGVDAVNSQNYAWKVTNNHDQPIVSIQFDHYRADTLVCPDGWSQDWKNRSMVGGKNAPGFVRAYVEKPADGIPANRSESFQMRISLSSNVMARPGKAIVKFADGTEVTVDNVEVPSAQSLLERNAMVIGMAVLFVVALTWHASRRKRLQAESTDTPAPPPADAE